MPILYPNRTHWGRSIPLLSWSDHTNYTNDGLCGVKVHDTLYCYKHNKANLRDLIAATDLVSLLKIGFKSSIFFNHVTLKFDR